MMCILVNTYTEPALVEIGPVWSHAVLSVADPNQFAFPLLTVLQVRYIPHCTVGAKRQSKKKV